MATRKPKLSVESAAESEEDGGEVVTWCPQEGPQTAAVHCPVPEIFYGGARGGGKTDCALGRLLIKCLHIGKGVKGIFFRRTYKQLEEVVSRAKELYTPHGAVWKESSGTFTFPNGAIVKFRYLDSDDDAQEYQGHSYCVGVGTPVLMADGSYKPIESIEAGELVQTLEGAKRVRRTVKPYLAECVKAVAYDSSGLLVGHQIHPASHPILTSVESSQTRKGRTPQTSAPLLRNQTPWRSVLPPSCEGLTRLGASSLLASGQTYCKEFEEKHREEGRLLLSSVPAVLHAPDRQSMQCVMEKSTSLHALDKSSAPLSSTHQKSDTRSCDQISPLSRPFLRRSCRAFSNVCDRFSTHAAYAFCDCRRLLNSLLNCFFCFRPYDGLIHCHSGCVPNGAPSQVYAEKRARVASVSGETDCTRECNQKFQCSAYIHPYTAEMRPLEVHTELGRIDIFYEGFAFVSDLNVEDSNHYITKIGLVNCNTDVIFEELGNFPSPTPIMKLKATLRSTKGIPCQMFSTGNPGGPGSNWIRARYIDPAPQGWVPITEVEERKLPDGKVISVESSRIYIPSRITDNKLLLQNDPGYLGRLMQSGSEELVRAWLDGDFYAIDGAFFDVFDQKKHVIKPFEIPAWWLKFRAMDWGSAKPFCNLWIAMPDEDFKHPSTGHIIPRGALIVYREWYGVKVKKDGTIQANVGIKLFAEEVGTGIQEREGREHIHYGVLDPSAFSVDGGSSIAERMYRSTNGKVAFRRADNKRVGTLGALSGWDQVRGRLVGEPSFDGKDTVPMLYFFSNCHHILRTLPAIQHDPDNVEDIDTDSEDHAADALRYGCMSRPYSPTKPSPPKKMTTIADVTIDKLWYDHENKQRSLSMRRI